MKRYETLREQMVARLQSAGIEDQAVLQAMRKIPRHEFVARGLEDQAYDEKALPIGFGQTISHPYTVALMTQTLQVRKGQRILEIGTGSGYQAAVLCELGAQVFTVERIEALGREAEARLRRFNYHFVLRIGDGTLGWQSYAPYDAIIVTAGAPIIPENLMHQVKEDGRLLIPVGNLQEQMLTLYLKQKGKTVKMEIDKLSFVPLSGRRGW